MLFRSPDTRIHDLAVGSETIGEEGWLSGQERCEDGEVDVRWIEESLASLARCTTLHMAMDFGPSRTSHEKVIIVIC